MSLREEAEHTSPEARSLRDLATPALLVDGARLARNLEAMQALADRHGVRLRPHLKSHKCLELGRRQQDAGARGLCAAKVSEAAVFATGGFTDLLVAYPLAPPKALDLARLTAKTPGLRAGMTVDSSAFVDGASAAARRYGVELGVWVEIDTGLRRCGLPPDSPEVEALAARIAGAPGLRFAGLLTHAGHAYKAATPAEAAAVGREEGEQMVAAAARLRRAGLGEVAVGFGSTPTAVSATAVAGVGELHAGVYVFGDRQQVRLGAMHLDHVSLTVLATVVGRPAPGRWVVDAGSKTLSSDQGAHGTKGVVGFGLVRRLEEHHAMGSGAPFDGMEAGPVPGVPFPAMEASSPGGPVLTRLSEEHGVLECDHDLGLEPGDLVEIVPNHACAAVNLADRLLVTAGAGEARFVTEEWPIAARGCVR